MSTERRRRTRIHVALGTVVIVAALSIASAASASPAAQALEPPVNRAPPRIEGTAQVGRILRANRGTWRRDQRASYSYQWRLCEPAGRTCVDVAGANDGMYAARQVDSDGTIQLAVTATTGAGSATALSAPTAVVARAPEGAPVATVRPSISGKVEPGLTLTAERGEWAGEQPLRFRYQWRRCGADGGACEPLPSGNETYAVKRRDVGRTFRVLIRAENSAGESASLSDATPSPATAPGNTSPPLISGVPAQGKTLTASTGAWSGTPPLSFSFQWLRCAKSGSPCARITRANAQAYTLTRADVDRSVRVRVSARNAAGSSSALSEHSRVVVGLAAPVNVSPPGITGTAREGETLTVSPGEWRGAQPILLRYQWFRCDSGGRACAAIRGATDTRRDVDAADVGRTLRVRVTAANDGGSSRVLTSPSAVVAGKGAAPANTTAPVLSGTSLQGERLRLSTGSWTGTQPIAYSYRWVRCDAALRDCDTIGGAGGNNYVLTRADVGKRVYGVVTARNSTGASSASSNATRVVIGAPVSTSLPRITGDAIEGRVLSASTGTWAGVTPMTFGYQWTRCNAQGQFSSCAPIVVTSLPTYTVRAADVGRRIFVQVKAQNRFGASFVNSDLTPVVVAARIGTLTIRSSRPVVVYGQRIVLTGRVVGAPPGQPVTLVERPATGGVRVLENVAVTSQGGSWTVVLQPRIQAAYQVRVRGATSNVVSVRVRPRLRLQKVGANGLSVRVRAARSFAGRTAILQRWIPRRQRWVGAGRIRLRAIRNAPPLTAGATFSARAPRGALLRVVLTGRQAWPGYLTGTSNRVRR
jgi:hypothetical protein